MKFLVIRKPRVSTALTPTSKAIREHKEAALDAVKRGSLDCIYAFPGGGGSVSIENADSAEQLNETLAKTPLFLFSEWMVHPLSDYARYMDDIATAFEKQGR
jgi:muconolactone delta-isomerase